MPSSTSAAGRAMLPGSAANSPAARAISPRISQPLLPDSPRPPPAKPGDDPGAPGNGSGTTPSLRRPLMSNPQMGASSASNGTTAATPQNGRSQQAKSVRSTHRVAPGLPP